MKNDNINAMDAKSDNVLFSVSNCKGELPTNVLSFLHFKCAGTYCFLVLTSLIIAADRHTDGASKGKVYDLTSLLCINPSGVLGGRSEISNACNAYDKISWRMPKFLLDELHHPVARDILEKEKGNKRCMSIGSILSRTDLIMPLWISYKLYPIYDGSF